MRRVAGESGSVFIETLIAAAIVVLLLGAMYRVITDSAARHGGLEARRTAMLIARSELAAVGPEIPAATGRYAGFVDAYAWRVEVSPYGSPAATAPLALVVVSVRARASGDLLATLKSVRLAAVG